MDNQSLTPKVIKEELDRYVIGQDDAKKAVAIALRNRWRRLNVKDAVSYTHLTLPTIYSV